jgi:hypothetical protein
MAEKDGKFPPPFTKGGLSKLNHEVTLINFLVIYGT